MKNAPVNLFTNGSYWFCPECGEENIVVAARQEVDIHDPSVRDLVEHLFETGEFDDLIEDEDEDDDGEFEESGGDGVRLFMPTGTIVLFREPKSVQCGSCHDVYPTRVLSVEESYAVSRGRPIDPPAEE